MTYDLSKLGTSLPHHQRIVKELGKDGVPDGNGPRYGKKTTSECHLLGLDDADRLLQGAYLLGAHVADNDQEIWFATEGNEIIRATGDETVRYYIVDPAFAEDMMEPYTDADAVETLKRLAILPPSAPAP